MELVKSYPGGTVTAEIFEMFCPDKPQVFLMDFLKTNKEFFMLFIPAGEDENGNPLVGVTRIDRKYAQRLLDEFREIT